MVTDKGEIRTSKVLNTAGPWGKKVAAMVGIDLPIEVQRQQLVDVKPTQPWPLDRTTVADHVQRLYIIPRKDGMAHIGGHYSGKNADPDNYNEQADPSISKT